ncbi:MAG: HAD family hydrolase [Methanomicrobiales archaeon]|nr:HAD family hydrolase [Methanomicrobiales archaeon]
MVTLQLDGHRIPGIRLAIFDKDGTLMELYHYWAQMVELRASLLRDGLGLSAAQEEGLILAMGVDREKGRLRPEGPVGIKKREVVMQAAVDSLRAAGFGDRTGLCISAFDEADRISSEDLRRYIRPIPGARELLAALAEGGCRNAIATTDRTARATLALEYLGFSGLVDLVVGADMVREAKPDPAMIRVILGKLGAGKEESVMVGDAVTDVQMGVNAGLAASIGVRSGLTPGEELARYTPYVVDDVSVIQVTDGGSRR